MTQQLLGRFFACVLAVMVPASMMAAETHAAMLYAAGTVTLNGMGAERSSAVFAGDSIQTPANGLVTLTTEGSTVLVGPSSLLVYEGTGVQLGAGTAMITTEKAMRTQVQRIVILPAAPGRSSYRVARGDGKLLIAALHGPVKISDGNSNDSKLLPEGETASMPDPQATPGATPGVTSVRLDKKKAAIIFGAATLAGALIVIETTKEPVSGK